MYWPGCPNDPKTEIPYHQKPLKCRTGYLDWGLIDHCLVNSTLHCTQLRLLNSGKDINSKLYFISVVKNTLKNYIKKYIPGMPL